MNELNELYFGKPKRQHVKEFGAIFCIIGCIIASFIIYKRGAVTTGASLFAFGGIIFAILAYTQTKMMLPLWAGWMKFAHYLGFFVTNIILYIAWIFMMVPIAILLKIFGKKVIDTRYDKSLESYWEDRTEKQNDFSLLERQF